MTLRLGTALADATAVGLPVAALARHVVALGASGSGKTVFCKVLIEEAVLQGIPSICIDPQGDLCSLALWAGELGDRADVVIFTPASAKGVPLCADPLEASLDGLEPDERLQATSRMAQMVVSLLGFDLDADDGAGLTAVIDVALGEMLAAGRPLRLAVLASYLAEADDAALARYEVLLDKKKIAVARQRLARLDVGARRLLFHEGVPVDIDVLLGRGERGGAVPGRTRVAVIYLNTLHSQEDKELFVAVVADRLYRWMLEHPSTEPQALFYIDEVAPFIPPVRKPACKDVLQLVFKQARKYGVSCLMATQNPGDVDYKAVAQFGTWALGRLTTRQDLKKVEPALKSLAPDDLEAIIEQLPAQKPGELMLVSPDVFDRPTALAIRWLHSEHRTLDEEAIRALADEFRDRFPVASSTLSAHPERSPERSEGRSRRATPAESAHPERSPERSEGRSRRATPAESAHPERSPERTEGRSRRAALDPLAEAERALAARLSMTTAELATKLAVGERKARTLLKALVEANRARSFRKGRELHYSAHRNGGRPDLDLGARVLAVVGNVGHERALSLGQGLVRSRLFGLLDDAEEVAGAELVHRAVLRADIEEQVARGALRRLVGPDSDRLRGSVYLHPRTLHVLTFSARNGLRFAQRPAEHATAVDDLDGEVVFDTVAPGELVIDEAAWKDRATPAVAKARLLEVFPTAKCVGITPVFVPLWALELRHTSRSVTRIVTIDAIVGQPVDWA